MPTASAVQFENVIEPSKIKFKLKNSVSPQRAGVLSLFLTFAFPILNRVLGPAGTFWTYATLVFA